MHVDEHAVNRLPRGHDVGQILHCVGLEARRALFGTVDRHIMRRGQRADIAGAAQIAADNHAGHLILEKLPQPHRAHRSGEGIKIRHLRAAENLHPLAGEMLEIA